MAKLIKTPEQVSEWLRKQKWIRTFVRTMRATHQSKKAATKILQGHYGPNTIAAGFCWVDSPQGQEYWHKIDQQLREWYYGT